MDKQESNDVLAQGPLIYTQGLQWQEIWSPWTFIPIGNDL